MTLKEAGSEEIGEIKGGFLRVRTEPVDGSLCRFLQNGPEAVNAAWRNTPGRCSARQPCSPGSMPTSGNVFSFISNSLAFQAVFFVS